VSVRRDRLERLKRAVLKHEDDLAAAISKDFGYRSEIESRLYDIHSVIAGIEYSKRHIARWMRPSRRRIGLHFLPASARVEYQPLGVVGVMSPWNYPVALALNPTTQALAAGNRVMLKPSEKTPATSALLATLIAETFSPEEVAVVLGGEAQARRFSGLAFDHLVFTGGSATGREVMRAASHHLVPVTLELGGKSPAVVLPDADIRDAARRIAYGKLANAGQTCIAPDYAMLPHDHVGAFVAEFLDAANVGYPNITDNPDYSSIANDEQLARLERLLADAEQKGATAFSSLASAGKPKYGRFMRPVLLTGVTDDMAIMHEEIFGPILPVVAYSMIDDAIGHINAGPRPLALYVFGGRTPERRRLLARTTSGTVGLNDTILQYAQHDLPFGGVGASGMGRYHGREGFENFSNVRSVFSQSRLNLASVGRPPFGKLVRRLLRYLNR
jgi:coniferyl-aldehyde dehydrogenase